MTSIVLRYIIPYLSAFAIAFFCSWLFWKKKPKDRKKDPVGVMDLILVLEGIAILAYIVVDFIVFWHTGNEPASLTISFFAICGGENGCMAWIKTRKEQERFRAWQKVDEGKPDEYKSDKGL